MGDPLLVEVDAGVPCHWRTKSWKGIIGKNVRLMIYLYKYDNNEYIFLYKATVLLYSAGSFFSWWMCSLLGLGRRGVIKVMRPKCPFSNDVDNVIFKNARDLFRNPLVETCGHLALQKSPALTERFILNDAPKCADL